MSDFKEAYDANKAMMRVPSSSKATGPNPKDVVGSTKASMCYLSPVARAHAVDAMMDGALKYDPYNWRAKKITAMNYLHAAVRHIDLWIEGEEVAADSGVHHLGHAIASLSILIDAQAHSCLIDDRPTGDGGKVLKAAHNWVSQNEKLRREIKLKGAQSGRLSGTKPNESNVPKKKQPTPATRG